MKIVIPEKTIEITKCSDCPFIGSHWGHGENWMYCGHDDAPTGYDNILYGGYANPKPVPKWCPLGLKELGVE